MDNKEILRRIDYSEERVRSILKELSELRTVISNNSDIENIRVQIKDVTLLDILNSDKLRTEWALKLSSGNRKAACKILNLTERTLYRKIKEYNLYK